MNFPSVDRGELDGKLDLVPLLSVDVKFPGVSFARSLAISEGKKKIESLTEAIREKVDTQRLNASAAMTLTDELASINAILEGLHIRADGAKKDTEEALGSIVESHKLLGLEMEKWILF